MTAAHNHLKYKHQHEVVFEEAFVFKKNKNLKQNDC